MVGYYTPFVICGTPLFAVGSGLITMYSIDISFGKWFGYQILAGAGIDAGFQTLILAVQTVLALEEVSVSTAMAMFLQTLGASLFVSVAQNVFQNGLLRGVAKYAPTLPPQILLGSGATHFRGALKIGREDQLSDAILAYMTGLIDTYRVTVACACAAFVTACFLEWKSVRDSEAKRAEGAEPVMAV